MRSPQAGETIRYRPPSFGPAVPALRAEVMSRCRNGLRLNTGRTIPEAWVVTVTMEETMATTYQSRPRACEQCGTEYRPRSNSQRFCDACGEKRLERQRRESQARRTARKRAGAGAARRGVHRRLRRRMPVAIKPQVAASR